MFVICSHTQYPKFYADRGFGGIWNHRNGCHFGIHGKSVKTFILVVANGLEVIDTHVLVMFLEFYAKYVQLVEIYNTKILATRLKKIGGTLIFYEQQFVTNFAIVL